MLEVTVIIDGIPGARCALGEDGANVGRSADWAQVHVEHPTVSRKHGRLMRCGGSWVFDALKPVRHNGGGKDVGPSVLAPGDTIDLSPAVTLQFEEAAASAPPQGASPSPHARVLADLIAEAERGAQGIAVLRGLEFPVLISGRSLSAEAAGTTAIYPLGGLVEARRARGRPPQLRLGRGEARDILVAADVTVSKRHAILLNDAPDRWVLVNLGRAITRVDGELLGPNERVRLAADVLALTLGKQSEFTFCREEGFRLLFRKLLASRMCAMGAGTVDELRLDQLTTTPLGPIGKAIWSEVQPWQNSRWFRVVLENALMEEASSSRELIDLIAELDDQIVKVVARGWNGEDTVAFERADRGPGS